MIYVQDFHSAFRLQYFYLQGSKVAGTLLHVHVRIHPTGSTHDPQISNVYFRGYTEYGMVLGEASETELGAGELSNAVCTHLTFNNNVWNATGMLINAQNLKVGHFASVRFDNDASGCAAPGNPSQGECLHRNHIFHKAGRVTFYSLTTTRAQSYAIYAWDTINVHGWDSEDPLLYNARAVPFCCPTVISGLLHRGNFAPNAIMWAATPSLTVSDAILSGDLTVGAVERLSVLTSNVQFRGNASLNFQGPSKASHIGLSTDRGSITLRSPAPVLELQNELGRPTLKAADGGLALFGGTLNTTQGSDIQPPTIPSKVIQLTASGNFFVVRGVNKSTVIASAEPVFLAGTAIILLFDVGAYLPDDASGNLQLAGPFEAGADDTLGLVSDGKRWLETTRSKNHLRGAGPAMQKSDDPRGARGYGGVGDIGTSDDRDEQPALLPPWRPTWDMARSTIIEPCSSTTKPFNASFCARFGICDYNWSEQKALWSQARPMNCSEVMVAQAELTKLYSPDVKVFVYRNLVKVGALSARARANLGSRNFYPCMDRKCPLQTS